MSAKREVGRVEVKTTWPTGEKRTDGASYGEQIIELYAPSKAQLVADINTLARVVSGSYDDLDGGTIILVRRKRP